MMSGTIDDGNDLADEKPVLRINGEEIKLETPMEPDS